MIIQSIRTGKLSKIVASYLALQLILQVAQPTAMWALTGGPKQPEFNSFTPIGTSDMVDLASGDFNYNIPIMDVGGYPLNLSYQSGVTMDQEASWVGLGWNLNVGQINRNVRGIPDDFKGDEIKYTDESKPNKTIGASVNINGAFFGFDALKLGVGVGVEFNNYSGVNATFSLGPTFKMNENVSVGFQLNGSATGGASVSPSVSYSTTKETNYKQNTTFNSSVGVTYSSRQGLSSLNLSAALENSHNYDVKRGGEKVGKDFSQGSLGGGGSISFAKPTYTPTKRTAYKNSSYTFSFATGGEIFGAEIQGQYTGYVSTQKPANPIHSEKAYGYDHTDLSDGNSVLDFNRENDRSISLNTNALSSTNYTYDLYSIQGQGIGGQFRPHRSKIGYLYDNEVNDSGHSASLALEIGGGNLVHGGVDANVTINKGRTGLWSTGNQALNSLNERTSNLDKGYEKVYYKGVGQLDVDEKLKDIYTNLKEDEPIRWNVAGRKRLSNTYENTTNNSVSNMGLLGRERRVQKNQLIQKFTFGDILKYDDKFIDSRLDFSPGLGKKEHHTAGYKVLQPDGSTYVFGKAVYNQKKVEHTFDIAGASNPSRADLANGTVQVSSRTSNNSSDRYVNKIETPAYVHSYLLTHILSSDYEDVNGNGLDDSDLGTYTKFTYKKGNNNRLYKWRVPYNSNESTYNEGLKTLKYDQKGNYLYGQKELFYVDKIETKTHVATFHYEDRQDGEGAATEASTNISSIVRGKQSKLKLIKLYSKPDYEKNSASNRAIPIKEAHFSYDYSLCPNSENSSASTGGKLTLKKVWFTYQNSKIGKYTPYEFNYGQENNYPYQIKSYNIWGNYKPFASSSTSDVGVRGELTSAEYPFVEQESRELQNKYASAWSLEEIKLPSGGTIDLEYESDSYSYVQDKKAMRMFKIIGVGNNPDLLSTGVDLYGGNYLYVRLDHRDAAENSEFDDSNANDFKRKYLGNHYLNPIYFRFLVNMGSRNSSDYDFVTGYLRIDRSKTIGVSKSGGYAAIPINFVDIGEGVDSNDKVNPISKSGWYFARKYLNNFIFNGDEFNKPNIKEVAKSLVNAIDSLAELIIGANGVLRRDNVARYCVPNKSWVRLQNPSNEKLGGGIRVKKLKMFDNWSDMTTNTNSSSKFYGQEYDYNLLDGSSSGVATYEPNSSKENPLITPYYDDDDKLLAPADDNYVETPFGSSFYPTPQVTYSRVKVTSLKNNEGNAIKRHDTGDVITEFYTSRDFPTVSKITEVEKKYKQPGLGSILNLVSIESLTLSQGFSIVTNDMNGKEKRQSVYAENQSSQEADELGSLISKVEYQYNISKENPQELDNDFITINEKGDIKKQTIGVDFDVVNDFRESSSETNTAGARVNFAAFIVGIFPGFVPTVFPEFKNVKSSIHVASTTKVVHKRGVLKKKIAYDLGARVATENIAWDANTGNILVTKTENEYDDNYYNITYPAYWHYKGMGLASDNFRVKGTLEHNTGNYFNGGDLQFLNIGDELQTSLSSNRSVDVDNDNAVDQVDQSRLWVIDKNNSGVVLMTTKGYVLNLQCNDFQVNGRFNYEIVRSGKRNLQTATMASVTTKTNPIVRQGSGYQNLQATTNVVNASAVEYSDYWESPNEGALPILGTNSYIDNSSDFKAAGYGFNPYRFNVKGNYRAVESYAFLSNRTNFNQTNLSSAGTITNFEPFYMIENNQWTIDKSKWTSASKVTKYHPNGNEIENKDALNRYSSAQYGYNNTLPIAVASNSAYNEMAYDGFEDYLINPLPNRINYKKKHFDVPYFSESLFNPNSAKISSANSHTGRYSIRVPSGASANISRNLGNCDPLPIQTDYCLGDDISARALNFHQDTVTSSYTPNYVTYQNNVEGGFLVKGSPYESITLRAEILYGFDPAIGFRARLNVAGYGPPYFFGHTGTKIEGQTIGGHIYNYNRSLSITFVLDQNGEREVSYSLEGYLHPEYTSGFNGSCQASTAHNVTLFVSGVLGLPKKEDFLNSTGGYRICR